MDLSNLSTLFSSFLTEFRTCHVNEALCTFSLAFPNCQHLYSCPLGPLLSKIRVTWTEALQHHRGDLITESAWLMGKPTGQRHESHPEQDRVRFHHATQNGPQFKLWIVYFWNFPFSIFWLLLTAGNKLWKEKPQTRETTVNRCVQQATTLGKQRVKQASVWLPWGSEVEIHSAMRREGFNPWLETWDPKCCGAISLHTEAVEPVGSGVHVLQWKILCAATKARHSQIN